MMHDVPVLVHMLAVLNTRASNVVKTTTENIDIAAIKIA